MEADPLVSAPGSEGALATERRPHLHQSVSPVFESHSAVPSLLRLSSGSNLLDHRRDITGHPDDLVRLDTSPRVLRRRPRWPPHQPPAHHEPGHDWPDDQANHQHRREQSRRQSQANRGDGERERNTEGNRRDAGLPEIPPQRHRLTQHPPHPSCAARHQARVLQQERHQRRPTSMVVHRHQRLPGIDGIGPPPVVKLLAPCLIQVPNEGGMISIGIMLREIWGHRQQPGMIAVLKCDLGS
ncbi:MAG: hypothetical protein ACR2GS_09115 [Thermomicrobiales bacterium]